MGGELERGKAGSVLGKDFFLAESPELPPVLHWPVDIYGGSTWMQMTAQSWLVLTLTTPKYHDLGLTVAAGLPCRSCSSVLMAASSPSQVDKRRLILIALQIAMGFQALMLRAALVVFDSARFREICLLAIVLGLNNAFENSARQDFRPGLVDQDELRNAITLNSVTLNAACRAYIEGVLIATVGIKVCFLLNARRASRPSSPPCPVMDRSAPARPPSGRASRAVA